MADRALFQMDQAASPDKGILRHVRECSEDPGMDCHLGLSSCSNSEKTPETGPESLRNITDSQRNAFRENTHRTGAFSCRTQQIRELHV